MQSPVGTLPRFRFPLATHAVAAAFVFACASPASADEGARWLRFADFGSRFPVVPAGDATWRSPVPVVPVKTRARPTDWSRFRLSSWLAENEPGRFRLVPVPLAPPARRIAIAERELSMAVYAETGGLFPKQAASGSIYDASTWSLGVPGGASDLHFARRMIAETRKGNKNTHLLPRPSPGDRIAVRAWIACSMAAGETCDGPLFPLSVGERLHFFIRQNGAGRQKADYLADYEPVLCFGPFVNVGGGDVPKGAATFIDFYVLPVNGR